jgi:hypothetical protein
MVSRLGNILKRREKNKQENNNKRVDGDGEEVSFQTLLNSNRVLRCWSVPKDTILAYHTIILHSHLCFKQPTNSSNLSPINSF